MIAYHIDRDHQLKQGQVLGLYHNLNELSFLERQMFPDGLSYHGLHYINEDIQNVGGNIPSYYIMEYELELIRKCYFPSLPSRFQSFFALKSLDDVKQWSNIWDTSAPIWSIEYNESQSIIRDSNLLYPGFEKQEFNDYFHLNNSFLYYYNYWNGYNTPHPRLEILISPPIKILDLVQPEHISS